jgi:hypothetical protein
LRKGQGDKQAVLYEVVAEETTEEGVSRRRRVKPKRPSPQLELVPPSPYEVYLQPTRKAAESGSTYGEGKKSPLYDDDDW